MLGHIQAQGKALLLKFSNKRIKTEEALVGTNEQSKYRRLKSIQKLHRLPSYLHCLIIAQTPDLNS